MNNYNNYQNNTEYTSPGPGPGGNKSPDGGFWDTLSWIIGVGLIFVWFPAGLFFTIAHALGHDFIGKLLNLFRGSDSRGYGAKSTSERMGGRDPHAYHSTSGRQAGTPTWTQPGAGPAAAAAGPEETRAAQTPAEVPAPAGVRRADAGAKIRTVFGWILVGLGAVGALAAAGSGLWALLTWLALALGGGALVLSASLGRKKEAMFRRMLTVSGTEGLVRLDMLAGTMGMKPEALNKVLVDMIDRGYYGPDAYIDHQRGLLVIQPFAMRDVYRAEDMEKAAREAREAKDTARAAEEAGVGQEYARILAQIRQADEKIADEAMSEKIRRMQTITAAIFREVEAHPEKKSQIRRFMNYYLPTTLKLLDNYARIEAQGVTGRNTAKAKADIEGIADTLVEGYEKQLDALYTAEAMDIAGDVSVIENMMKRDGLTGEKGFGQTMGGT